MIRSRQLQVLGYTNNALTGEQRREALSVVADHATAGRLTADLEPVPLAEVGAAWARSSTGRIVLTL